MILDHITNSHLYKNIHPILTKGLEYIENTDFSKLKEGKHIIQGEAIFGLLQSYFTKPEELCRLEAHKTYVDIQFIIQGEEYIGITPLNNQEILEAIPENDLTFYKGKGDKIRVSQGSFAIFFQTDAHAPGIQIEKSEKVVKVVIKVAMSLDS